MPLIQGQILEGKYEVVRLLARGGIGEVYLGVNRRLDKRVAIKVLAHALAHEPVAARRFEQEARVATRICSAHVADTYDLGTLPSGESFIVMELLEGETMGERLERDRRLDEPSLAAIALQILDALAAAHAAGVVHRDLKPENVFLSNQDGRDFVKLLDFGISKVMDAGGGEQPRRDAITVTGAVLGTPLYMSPEQARGQNVDGRTDLYALGVMLYEAVLGEAPFQGKNVNELLFRVALDNATPLELRLPSVSPELASIVRTAMAKSLRERYASAAAMREDVLAWQAAVEERAQTIGVVTTNRRGDRMRTSSHAVMPTPRPWSVSHDAETELDLDDVVPRRRSKVPLVAAAMVAGLVALGATHPQKVRAMSAAVTTAAQRAQELRVPGPDASASSSALTVITIDLPPKLPETRGPDAPATQTSPSAAPTSLSVAPTSPASAAVTTIATATVPTIAAAALPGVHPKSAAAKPNAPVRPKAERPQPPSDGLRDALELDIPKAPNETSL